MSDEFFVMNSRLQNPSSSTRFKTNAVVAIFAAFLVEIVLTSGAYADEQNAAAMPPVPVQPMSAQAGSGNGSRNFYIVMDELLSDFEYDLKAGQVIGLKDVSIRNIVTSENVPPSFKSHLELLLSERILKTTKARVVHCAACRSKKATLSGENMTISSPENNSGEMQRIAKLSGIQNFMDAAFAYQPSGMVLSLQISDIETGSTLWSRTYNSETSRAAAQRRGVDYQEIEDAKTKMEYSPTLLNRPSLSMVMAPKAGSGYSTSLALGWRMMERYDNRKKEVGFELNYYKDIPSWIGSATAAEKKLNIYSGFNLTMLFMHGWSLFGNEENYNQARGVILGGIGGTYASGFLGALIRGGYEWRLAKHWSVDAFLGYRPKGTLVISTGTTASINGVEGGIGVGFIY